MKQIQFFAVRTDILQILEAVERDGPLQYVRTGNQLRPDFETFSRGTDIPNLGVADRETGSVCKAFLVAKAAVRIAVRSIKGASGVQRYLMDQLLNPDTVTLRPAGMWREHTVLQGVVGTASDSPISLEMMKKFSSAFRKSFTKIEGRFVGPQAFAIFRAGTRLTIAEQSPQEFDLTPVQ